jgi:hypothetical protein
MLVSRVRVRPAPETQAIGAAGRVGIIVGEIVPSSSGVPVVGPVPDDLALAVMFDGSVETVWFRPELLEVIGEQEVSVTPGRPTSSEPVRRPPWLRRLRSLITFDS